MQTLSFILKKKCWMGFNDCTLTRRLKGLLIWCPLSWRVWLSNHVEKKLKKDDLHIVSVKKTKGIQWVSVDENRKLKLVRQLRNRNLNSCSGPEMYLILFWQSRFFLISFPTIFLFLLPEVKWAPLLGSYTEMWPQEVPGHGNDWPDCHSPIVSPKLLP